MARLIFLIIAVVSLSMANAETFSYRFNSTPLPKAIQKIVNEHPDLDINFIYNELESYKTSSTVNADNASDALRQLVGLNPVMVTKTKNTYYIEAFQHGKYVYTGRVTGTDKDPVVGATVMLLAPKDSTVLTYGVTDVDGSFSIPCDRKGVILAKFSCIGYKTSLHKLKSFNVGTVIMQENAISLSTVNVVGNSAAAYSDKIVYLPTQRQKNASQNATDLLRFMAIPQIKIDITNNAVTDNFGNSVSLFINGIEATNEELDGLRTADVRRVEYLEFPTDPRYKGAQIVVNFIVQEYAFGGYTKATISENLLVGLSSKANIFSKFSYKKLNYDLYVGSNNWNNHHIGSEISGNYFLGIPEKGLVTKSRKEILDYSQFKENQIPVTLRATYSTDKIQISNTAGFVHDNTPVSELEGRVEVSDSDNKDKFRRLNPTRKNSAIYSGSFLFVFPKNYSLDVTPTFNYTHTDDRFLYDVDENRSIVRNAEEDAFIFRTDANARKTFGQKHSLTAGINGGQIKNNLQYSGTNNYKDKFRLSFVAGQIGYNYHTAKISLITDFGACWEGSNINGKIQTDLYPYTHIYFQFTPTNKHRFSSYFQYANNSPTISQKASDILQDNEYLFITGNPFIKNSRHVTFNLSYTWLPMNSFSMSAFGEYFGNYNRVITKYSPYQNGEAVIRDYVNNGDYNRGQIGLAANLKLFDGKLQIYASPRQYFYRSTGIYNTVYNPFTISAQAVLYLGQFYVQGYYSTPERRLWDESNTIYRSRNYHSIAGGWSNSNWNVRITAANMFNKGWVTGTLTMNSDYYSETRINYGLNSHPRLNLSVTYTIGYGKKVQQGNEVGEQSGASSAILK
ncbi:MAG: hypothetical protein HDT07_02190 [Bacteroidales bacterium]|nr:hypothetical protein [Bacteroidales bacterium]